MTQHKTNFDSQDFSNCPTVTPNGEQTTVQPETTNSITTEGMITINDTTTTSEPYGPMDIRGPIKKFIQPITMDECCNGQIIISISYRSKPFM